MRIFAILITIQGLPTKFRPESKWAFRFIDTETGNKVEGVVWGGESNIMRAVNELKDDWNSQQGLILRSTAVENDDYFWTQKKLTRTLWKAETAGWAEADPDIAQFIREKLGWRKPANA